VIIREVAVYLMLLVLPLAWPPFLYSLIAITVGLLGWAVTARRRSPAARAAAEKAKVSPAWLMGGPIILAAVLLGIPRYEGDGMMTGFQLIVIAWYFAFTIWVVYRNRASPAVAPLAIVSTYWGCVPLIFWLLRDLHM
jgi:hypothetical protein